MLENRGSARRRQVLDLASPISAGDVIAIRALPAEARFVLRLDGASAIEVEQLAGADITIAINRFSTNGARTAVRLGPDEWLLLAPEADAELVRTAATAALRSRHHTLVDVSHRNVGIEVSGSAAADVLNAGCPLDLSTDKFTAGSAARTLLGKAEIVLMRLADRPGPAGAAIPVYRIECWRSFGRYVHAFLSEAALEHLSSERKQ